MTASAFGGLLAYGIFHINNGKLYPWAYLYLVEGSLTLLVAAVAFFVLPRNLQTTYFLTQAEKEAGTALQLMDSVSEVTTVFSWAEALSEFRTWHVYVRMIIAFTFGVLLNSNANFLAIMTQRLGYDVVKTNLVCLCFSILSTVGHPLIWDIVHCRPSGYVSYNSPPYQLFIGLFSRERIPHGWSPHFERCRLHHPHDC